MSGAISGAISGDPTPPLACVGLVAGYEPDLPIVKGASLAVRPGEILAIFGPNGAGKSTLVKAIVGLVPVASGRVMLAGEDITGLPAHSMIHRGLAFVPQTENIFAAMTVRENLELAAAIMKVDRKAGLARLYDLFPDLARQQGLAAGRLSGGQRQMLAAARALVADPAVLILDEPSAGLSPKLVELVFERLKAVRDSGVTIVLVEQNVKAALAIADRAAVIVEGRERLVGTVAEVARPGVLADLFFGPHVPAKEKPAPQAPARTAGAA
jgi:branched-chain amino acid transport system ATP-binding protein